MFLLYCFAIPGYTQSCALGCGWFFFKLSITINCLCSDSESAAKTEDNQAEEASPEAPQENTAGKWQVLEPDVAAAVDASYIYKDPVPKEQS